VAEAEYQTTARLPVRTVWDFVREMDQWARFVTGYQGHEKQSDTESTWTLKGDVGVLARRLVFKVHITEWKEPERVSFRLTGVNEPMQGAGEFVLEPFEDASAPATEPLPRRGFWLRLLERIARALLRLVGGAPPQRAALAAPEPGASRLTFRLRLDPGGPMAPMINAMIRPLLLPAAESLADQILAHLESREPAA
jgi:carbon monoxide dehydrogenase subunit G